MKICMVQFEQLLRYYRKSGDFIQCECQNKNELNHGIPDDTDNDFLEYVSKYNERVACQI